MFLLISSGHVGTFLLIIIISNPKKSKIQSGHKGQTGLMSPLSVSLLFEGEKKTVVKNRLNKILIKLFISMDIKVYLSLNQTITRDIILLTIDQQHYLPPTY